MKARAQVPRRGPAVSEEPPQTGSSWIRWMPSRKDRWILIVEGGEGLGGGVFGSGLGIGLEGIFHEAGKAAARSSVWDR